MIQESSVDITSVNYNLSSFVGYQGFIIIIHTRCRILSFANGCKQRKRLSTLNMRLKGSPAYPSLFP